jgi:hypothetical protein
MKKVLGFLVPLLLVLFLCSGASANQWPEPPFGENTHSTVQLVNFLNYFGASYSGLSEDPSGAYYATLLGWEAWDVNKFGTDADGEFFRKGDFGAVGTWSSAFNFDTDGAHFWGNNSAYFDPSSPGVDSDIQMYALLQDVTILYDGYPDVHLKAGDIIAGYDDNPEADDNHDDLIVAFRAVPIPAPVLLLGLSLLGIVGVRRKILK